MAWAGPPQGNGFHPLGSKAGGGPEAINVTVREDKGRLGDMTVRFTGVRSEGEDQDEGPWGAKGPLWFFARLMTFITCVAIISTRSWARGGALVVDIAYNVPTIGNVSERVFLERSEIGLVTACYKGWSASSRIGPLDGEQCGYVVAGLKWDMPAWTAALVFAVLFVVVLSYRLSVEATELFFPGFLPVCFFVPTSARVLRHISWLFMLVTWACFVGGWQWNTFDYVKLDYDDVTYLDVGFWTWVTLWFLWFIEAILVEIGRL